MSTVTAPQAPGSLGEDVAPEVLLDYIDALGVWRDRRHDELDALDAAARDAHSVTADILLSMTLWKAVADRHDLIVSTWDSGRVLERERKRITTLIWGRLDQQAGDGSALAVSLPEACRLSDSLAASLRRTLGLDADGPGPRLRELRASLERVRDLVADVPPSRAASAREILVDLDRRLTDLDARADRGADVGGLIGPLEQAVATTERDLIVAAANRTRARDRLGGVRERVEELAARGEAVRSLAQRCAREVADAPTLGVPDVSALGAPDADDLDAYVARLDRVDRALEVARAAYASPLERRADLRRRLEVDTARIDAAPERMRDDATHLARRAEELSATPTDLTHLGALVDALSAYLERR
ncbi:MAG: hypothetical protein Q4G43_02205 [Mobilicoccus sp.]|nr:hypothetical protein [Mobilicoccus sp.]